MAIRKTSRSAPPRKSTASAKPAKAAKKTSARSTVSAPTAPRDAKSPASGDRLMRKQSEQEELVEGMPYNENKASEYGAAASDPAVGQTVKPPSDLPTASTVSETNTSDKTGMVATPGKNPENDPLDRVRVDSSGRRLTTNLGTPVADNQHSLKAGLRGPALLEDFILREKITHFDHERIPERVVHARGSGAHGYFECYKPLTDLTRASIFAEAGKRTPVFVRFSTVIGERGSADTVRDVRGFAVKFYTDEGNWDLVGNNIPVFFIQDAMKFPDLIHAAKPEPHFAMPQAATAHDTFWDFVSLTPESTHMLMWAMSDRALPRSYRMMEGFGVHTFRFVNAKGESKFVKFHWEPIAGTHSLDWDETVKIAGADPDFNRRDLWESIEAGAYPEFEFGVQIFSEEQAEAFSFDVLDATKIVPEELVPITPIGKMVLDRNPDYFFGETEQVAFCAAHIVPGIDFSNDPLLAGRLHSYQDTQLLRLGGPNFHEIPINASVSQVHNNTRDGFHRQSIHRGRVSYEPNSLAGGCPFQAGAAGFTSFPEPIHDDKVRGKPEKFADHYTQATLFWNSQTPIEKAHIIRAYRFELTKVQTTGVRERVVSMLANVATDLAEAVAAELGMEVPEPMPKALDNPQKPEIDASPRLSLFARPGDGSIRTRKIAILIADGVEGEAALALHEGLAELGAVPRFIAARLGQVQTPSGDPIDVEATLETTPSVLYDAVAIPDGEEAAETLAGLGQALEFIKDQYRHCKPILALGAGKTVLDAAEVPTELPAGGADPGVLALSDESSADALQKFVAAIAAHRHFERATDPPEV
jgi:catalase